MNLDEVSFALSSATEGLVQQEGHNACLQPHKGALLLICQCTWDAGLIWELWTLVLRP